MLSRWKLLDWLYFPTVGTDSLWFGDALRNPDDQSRRLLGNTPVKATDGVPAIVNSGGVLDRVTDVVDDVDCVSPVVWFLHVDVDPELAFEEWGVADSTPQTSRQVVSQAPDVFPYENVPAAVP